MLRAQRPIASRLASPTWPASSTTSVSKAPANSGLQKWKAVPPTTSAAREARRRWRRQHAPGSPPARGCRPSRACAPARRSRSSAPWHRPAAPRGRRGAGSRSPRGWSRRRPPADRTRQARGWPGRRHGSCRCPAGPGSAGRVLHRQHGPHRPLDGVRAAEDVRRRPASEPRRPAREEVVDGAMASGATLLGDHHTHRLREPIGRNRFRRVERQPLGQVNALVGAGLHCRPAGPAVELEEGQGDEGLRELRRRGLAPASAGSPAPGKR